MLVFCSCDEVIVFVNCLFFGFVVYVMMYDMCNVVVVLEVIQSGNVIVNYWQVLLFEMLFGGYKDSGLGSEGGIEGLQEFQVVKYVSQFVVI